MHDTRAGDKAKLRTHEALPPQLSASCRAHQKKSGLDGPLLPMKLGECSYPLTYPVKWVVVLSWFATAVVSVAA